VIVWNLTKFADNINININEMKIILKSKQRAVKVIIFEICESNHKDSWVYQNMSR
jgi:hypothetical protein